MLQRQSLWVAFLAGPGPHVEMVGALSVILASGAAANTQAAAVPRMPLSRSLSL
ncbi:MAG: hypothetical protein QOG79_5238, partial [Mycobacterium sp.]|nr:hypothetical protein [Mycobacterium sp.]